MTENGRAKLLDYSEYAVDKWWALTDYNRQARRVLNGLHAQPNVIAIRYAKLSDVYAAASSFQQDGDQVHFGPVGDRTIAVVRTRHAICENIHYAELVQTRPGVEARLGLDHLAVIIDSPDWETLEQTLSLVGVACELRNNATHRWLEISYDGFKFKLVDHELWDVCIAMMQAAYATETTEVDDAS